MQHTFFLISKKQLCTLFYTFHCRCFARLQRKTSRNFLVRLRANGRQQCCELLRACWQWCANGFNNSQHVWDLQCTVGRMQPIRLCNPCVMSVCGPNNVGRAVQTDPTLMRYASTITEQKKCWELLAEKFDRFQTLGNNTQQHPTTCNRECKRTQHPAMLGVVGQQCCVRLHGA